ncbi:Eukaryotic translation initiation factor eIF-1 [Coemansia brasiliensis]|uniref:Eukaryotic translation initiation factor eIF-1 n=1 Tax=Coemansia brasiliensis TaxID=2650707 RepID=A0A9W8ICH5_9FUNG|nr:Eukaryotic translation initiation factor eIF-1 [Coemansia brasiliensis]
MSLSNKKKDNADVNSSDEASTPQSVTFSSNEKDEDTELSSFSDEDSDKETKKAKETKKSRKPKDDFEEIDYSASLDPFGKDVDFDPLNPFDDKKKDAGAAAKAIHIRIQQRNARKSMTTLQGLPEQFDLKRLLKYFKKTFGCLGTIVKDKEHGLVIQLGGDQRAKLSEFLTTEGIAKKDEIKIHGF